jgi:hypothetical protein
MGDGHEAVCDHMAPKALTKVRRAETAVVGSFIVNKFEKAFF